MGQVIEINGKRLAILGVTSEIASEVAKAIGAVSNSTVSIDDEELIERVSIETSKIFEVGQEEVEQPSYRENVRKFLKQKYR